MINEEASTLVAFREAEVRQRGVRTFGRLLSVSAAFRVALPAGPASATLSLVRGSAVLAGAELRGLTRPGEPANPIRPGESVPKGEYLLSFDLRPAEPVDLTPATQLRLTVAGKSEDVRMDWEGATMEPNPGRLKSFSLKAVRGK